MLGFLTFIISMSFWARAKDILTWKRERVSEINNLKLHLHSFLFATGYTKWLFLCFKKINCFFCILSTEGSFLGIEGSFWYSKSKVWVRNSFSCCWNEYAWYYIILSYHHRIFWQQNLAASSAIAQGWTKDYIKAACLHLSSQQRKKKHDSIFNRALPLKCFLCLFFVLIKYTPFSDDSWSYFLITLLSEDMKKYSVSVRVAHNNYNTTNVKQLYTTTWY